MTSESPDPTEPTPAGPDWAAPAELERLPYGSWPSVIRVDDLVASVVRLGEPWIDGDDVYWIEGRADEAGRSVLVRHAADGTT
ncbi:MAG: hypothetical protein ACXW4L_07820, partial [Candidatus Limnocylindrales bacterium]